MHITKCSLATLALFAAVAAAGCNKPAVDGKALATVNGTTITQQDLDFSALPSGHGPAKPTKDLAYVIDEELMSQQGHRIGLDRDPTYQKQLARLQNAGHGMAQSSPERVRYVASQMRTEMARRVYDTQIAAKVDVRMPEAKEYFEKHRAEINTQLHLGLIKFADEKSARQALDKLRSGTPFEKLTGGKTADGTAGVRDIGFQPWHELPIDFVEPLYRLKPGETSGILGNYESGYQIVKLYETRRSPKELTFADVSATIMNGLRDLKIMQEHQAYLEQLKKQAKIVTF